MLAKLTIPMNMRIFSRKTIFNSSLRGKQTQNDQWMDVFDIYKTIGARESKLHLVELFQYFQNTFTLSLEKVFLLFSSIL